MTERQRRAGVDEQAELDGREGDGEHRTDLDVDDRRQLVDGHAARYDGRGAQHDVTARYGTERAGREAPSQPPGKLLTGDELGDAPVDLDLAVLDQAAQQFGGEERVPSRHRHRRGERRPRWRADLLVDERGELVGAQRIRTQAAPRDHRPTRRGAVLPTVPAAVGSR